jgi:hypothetical protein
VAVNYFSTDDKGDCWDFFLAIAAAMDREDFDAFLELMAPLQPEDTLDIAMYAFGLAVGAIRRLHAAHTGSEEGWLQNLIKLHHEGKI